MVLCSNTPLCGISEEKHPEQPHISRLNVWGKNEHIDCDSLSAIIGRLENSIMPPPILIILHRFPFICTCWQIFWCQDHCCHRPRNNLHLAKPNPHTPHLRPSKFFEDLPTSSAHIPPLPPRLRSFFPPPCPIAWIIGVIKPPLCGDSSMYSFNILYIKLTHKN